MATASLTVQAGAAPVVIRKGPCHAVGCIASSAMPNATDTSPSLPTLRTMPNGTKWQTPATAGVSAEARARNGKPRTMRISALRYGLCVIVDLA